MNVEFEDMDLSKSGDTRVGLASTMPSRVQESPFIVRLILKTKITKSESVAIKIVLGFSVLVFILSTVFFYRSITLNNLQSIGEREAAKYPKTKFQQRIELRQDIR